MSHINFISLRPHINYELVIMLEIKKSVPKIGYKKRQEDIYGGIMKLFIAI